MADMTAKKETTGSAATKKSLRFIKKSSIIFDNIPTFKTSSPETDITMRICSGTDRSFNCCMPKLQLTAIVRRNSPYFNTDPPCHTTMSHT